jgi:hypothetical protein
MLYDEISVPDILDRECAYEFLKEATRLASSDELRDIGADLEAKSRLFQGALAEDAIGALDAPALLGLLDRVFLVRRKRRTILKRNELGALKAAIVDLLYGDDAMSLRFDRFAGRVKGIDQPLVIALASELLHFTDPARHWLWTSWIWEPKTSAGALPLVLNGDGDLRGATPGETYERVGAALDVLDGEGRSAGFTALGDGRFGTDVFLAAVYAVYAFTVFRMRLSKEFNQLLPELPELTRRILGVHRPQGGPTVA